jgi:hypothetical protein
MFQWLATVGAEWKQQTPLSPAEWLETAEWKRLEGLKEAINKYDQIRLDWLRSNERGLYWSVNIVAFPGCKCPVDPPFPNEWRDALSSKRLTEENRKWHEKLLGQTFQSFAEGRGKRAAVLGKEARESLDEAKQKVLFFCQ